MSLCVRCFLQKNHIRWMSVKRKLVPEFNTAVHKEIENESISCKRHPGVLKILPPSVPEKLLNAIKFISRDKPIKTFINDGIVLTRYLEGRHPPVEEDVVNNRISRFTERVRRQCNIDEETATPKENNILNRKVQNLLHKYTYNWKSLHYDSYLSFVYLLSRTAPEYATLCRVFNEIATRDKTFEPQTLFDFGSGVGTVSWAAKHFWNSSLKEFTSIDVSSHMNDIAQGLLQDGVMKLEPVKGVYYRQFLPSQHALYDIVVTAFTLFELPSRQTRLDTIINLWNKTRRYLVIVEQGTNAGFKLVTEARDFILLSNKMQNKENVQKGSVFAPCPHDLPCPRLKEDETPCNFEVNYNMLPLDSKERMGKQRFSYVILKRGSPEQDDRNWPRIVRSVIKRSGHTICRLCTAEGKLEEVIFSASKHGKIPYRCARASKWGDLLPVKLNEIEVVIDDEQASEDLPDFVEENETSTNGSRVSDEDVKTK